MASIVFNQEVHLRYINDLKMEMQKINYKERK